MSKHLKEFNYKGFKIVIDYDPFAENPRNWSESKWYGVDRNAPADLIMNEDGEIDPNCEELKDKIWFKVYKYEHSAVSFSLIPVDKWDTSFNGIIAVPKSIFKAEEAISYITMELECYADWYNGDVYGYQIFDADDLENEVDSCWSFYDLENCEVEAKGAVDELANRREIESVSFWANNSD